jgi:hypothetical protein
MSVRPGLEDALEILKDPRIIKLLEKGIPGKWFNRTNAVYALERALDHYKKEAERVKKYKEAPKNG